MKEYSIPFFKTKQEDHLQFAKQVKIDLTTAKLGLSLSKPLDLDNESRPHLSLQYFLYNKDNTKKVNLFDQNSPFKFWLNGLTCLWDMSEIIENTSDKYGMNLPPAHSNNVKYLKNRLTLSHTTSQLQNLKIEPQISETLIELKRAMLRQKAIMWVIGVLKVFISKPDIVLGTFVPIPLTPKFRKIVMLSPLQAYTELEIAAWRPERGRKRKTDKNGSYYELFAPSLYGSQFIRIPPKGGHEIYKSFFSFYSHSTSITAFRREIHPTNVPYINLKKSINEHLNPGEALLPLQTP